MTASEANNITKKGLRFAIAGFVVGIFLSLNQGLGIIFLWSYSLWALYHGVQLIQPIMRSLFDFESVYLVTHSVADLFWKSSLIKLLKIILPLVIGYFVGVMGGAILRQIYLLKIFYDHR